ncbi:hypothetical protein E2C01_035005 [Portunus trituberculatus]|uniref:Uncharacterized protein n=1 Tax=Portunus trituberculatus TaxID=210409 RepID=A0A5B7F8J5_PORTR|nr:hypothetical protein [Portunus trituberculatus]
MTGALADYSLQGTNLQCPSACDQIGVSCGGGVLGTVKWRCFVVTAGRGWYEHLSEGKTWAVPCVCPDDT